MKNLITRGLATAAAGGFAVVALSGAASASTAVPRFAPADSRVPVTLTAVVEHGADGTELTSTLSAAGAPVPGETITFTTSGSRLTLCSAVTDAAGTAECVITQRQVTLIRDVAAGIWYARYAGSPVLQDGFRAGHI